MRLGWIWNSRLPITTTLPLAVSGAILAVSLIVSTLGVMMLRNYSNTVVQQKAAVFIDSFAGHVPQPIGSDLDLLRSALTGALRNQSALKETHVAVGWLQNGQVTVEIYPASEDDAELRMAIADALLHSRQDQSFSFSDGQYARLTKRYTAEGSVFAVSALFDAGEVVEANNAAVAIAIALNALLAAVAVIITFLFTRRFAFSLRAFSARLAFNLDVAHDSPNELVNLEHALAARERSEDNRATALTRMAQVERDALLGRVAATIAHEMRNPLAGILSGLATIRRFGDDRAVREETLRIVEGGLQSLERIAGVTLATYRRRGGTKQIGATDLRDLGLLIGPEAKKKQLKIEWRIADDLSFETDADALRQILLNLLLNACQASPTGGVITFQADITESTVELTIIDQGAGLPASVLAYLKAGSNVQNMASRELGILVVSALVDDIGARLSVESRVEEGTRISIILPKIPVEEQDRSI